MSDFTIRQARPEDLEFILSLVPRLVHFGPPSWRDAGQMTRRVREVLSEVLAAPPPSSRILVAEDRNGVRAGFAHLETTIDYYTRQPNAHLSDLVVAEQFEGCGVGRLLLEAAADWGRSIGASLLTLNVFTANERARMAYERNGFLEELVKYVKPLH